MDEEHIKYLLGRIQPQPGLRFRQRMAAAPWQLVRERSARRQRAYLLAAASLLVIVLLFAAVPPLQGLARGWIRYFMPLEMLEVGEQAAGERVFKLDAEEAGLAAGFDLLAPTWLPRGFVFEGADYDSRRNAVIFSYLKSGGLLRLTQAMGQGTRELGSIGSSAQVQEVELLFAGQPLTAEYVAGAWRLSPFDRLLADQPDKVPVTLQANWDSEARIQILRWEFGGILYEIIHGDAQTAFFSPQVIIQIAEGMQ